MVVRFPSVKTASRTNSPISLASRSTIGRHKSVIAMLAEAKTYRGQFQRKPIKFRSLVLFHPTKPAKGRENPVCTTSLSMKLVRNFASDTFQPCQTTCGSAYGKPACLLADGRAKPHIRCWNKESLVAFVIRRIQEGVGANLRAMLNKSLQSLCFTGTGLRRISPLVGHGFYTRTGQRRL